MTRDLRWLLFLALVPAIFLIWRIAKHLGRQHRGFLEIFVFFFVPLSYGTYGLYDWLEPTPQKSEEEILAAEKTARSPNFLIRIYPFTSEMGTPYSFPLSLYHLDVQNVNQNSVPVHDLSIEFHFKNTIAEVKQQVVLGAGGGVAIYGKRTDGSTFQYYEESLPELSKKFSFQIQREASDKKMNLNFVDLYVERWVEDALFNADIVIDLSQGPPYFKYPAEVNSYKGAYVYEIRGKKFFGKINGAIPKAEDTRAK